MTSLEFEAQRKEEWMVLPIDMLTARLRDLLESEQGQDMIEYVLLAAVLALTVTAGAKTAATMIINVCTLFSNTVA